MTGLLAINPNISASMSRSIETAMQASLPEGVELSIATASFGFPVIATRLSYAVAAHAAVEAFAAWRRPCDAVILACFGDPGLGALRELAEVPVIGLAEASLKAATRRGQPFAIVTVGKAWVPMLRELVCATAAPSGFVGVFALDGTGLDALRDPQSVRAGLMGLVAEARDLGARTIILGGATLAGWAPDLPRDMHYVDCVAAAVEEALAVRPEQVSVTRQPRGPHGLSGFLLEMLSSPEH